MKGRFLSFRAKLDLVLALLVGGGVATLNAARRKIGAPLLAKTKPDRHSPHAPDPDPLDRQVLRQLVAMDRDGQLLSRLVRLYRGQAEGLAAQLAAALARGGDTDIRQLAHALKSMSLSIGAQSVANLAHDLEDQVSRGETVDPDMGPRIQAACAAALNAFDAELDHKRDDGRSTTDVA